VPLATLEVYGSVIASVAPSDGGEQEAAADSFDSLHTIFLNASAEFGLETSWRAIVDNPTTALANMAAAADLIVCGLPHESDARMAVDDLIMKAGRPVLVVPDGHDTLKWRHAVVVWKNTREARRAMSDALPLLARSAAVTLLRVRESDHEDDALNEPVEFLAHHGIGSTVKILPFAHRNVADQLLHYVSQPMTDLVVLGAFGHSRARERIFGGVTADLLGRCPVPCRFSQ
jgi:nucleotide-binding universal stress UspA family protein